MKLGIGGVVTFKNGKIDQFLSQLDLSHIVMETDAPYLAPVPYRGKRNEPAFVENVANFIANLRSTELTTIAKESCKNAEDLFKFDLLI